MEQDSQAERQRQQLTEQFRRPERSLWKDAYTQLIANRLAMVSIVVIAIVFFIAAFGPFLTPYDHLYQDWDNIAQPPTMLHPLGTDELGRDMLSRILAGGRTAIMVAVVTTTIAFILGVLIGAVGAYMGGHVDALVVRSIDFLQAFPHILLAVFLAATLKPSFIRLGDALVKEYGIRALGNTLYLDYLLIFAVLGITGWPGLARLVRGQVLSLRATEYVTSAQVVGARGMANHCPSSCTQCARSGYCFTQRQLWRGDADRGLAELSGLGHPATRSELGHDDRRKSDPMALSTPPRRHAWYGSVCHRTGLYISG